MREEESIVILKPDRGAGVVIMDKKEYHQKIEIILSDTSKFKRVGPASKFDRTEKIY